MKEIEDSIRIEALINSQSSYRDLTRTLPNLKRLFISVIIGIYAYWAGIGVTTYYLALVLNTIGITAVASQTLINGLLQILNFLTAVGSGLLVDRLGRRTLFLTSVGGMLICFSTWTALSARFAMTRDPEIGKGVLAFIFTFSFFFQIAFSPLLIAYVVEIWPYTLRSRGLTTSLAATYCGLLIGQFVTPIGLATIAWKYYIVFCILLVILLVIVWFIFPETRGRTLEEINEVFEGKREPESTDIKLDHGVIEDVGKESLARSHIKDV